MHPFKQGEFKKYSLLQWRDIFITPKHDALKRFLIGFYFFAVALPKTFQKVYEKYYLQNAFIEVLLQFF